MDAPVARLHDGHVDVTGSRIRCVTFVTLSASTWVLLSSWNPLLGARQAAHLHLPACIKTYGQTEPYAEDATVILYSPEILAYTLADKPKLRRLQLEDVCPKDPSGILDMDVFR